MESSALTDVLEDAGLSPYQAEAYVTVLQLGSASATDIAEESDVPDPRIYDVLRDLEKRGYIETYEQDSLHARPFSPDTVLDDLRERARKFESAADEIEDRWEAPTMETHTVSFVKRMETVLNKARAKINAADNQIQLAMSLDQYEQLKPALEAAYDRGVVINLALYGEEDAGDNLTTVSEFEGVASEVRYRTIQMPFVALVDRNATCFAPHDFSANRYGIIIEDRTHAYVFHWYFIAGLWISTDPLYEADDTARIYVNIRSCIRDVKPLLEAGKTVTASIQGIETDGNADVAYRGEIRDVVYPSADKLADDVSFEYLGGQATIVLDTGDEIINVGGWGAIIEEVEATRIVIEDIADD